MGITGSIIVYVMIWWVIFFSVLPVGIRSNKEVFKDKIGGVDPGAPKKPLLLIKATSTTLIAAVFWVAIYWFIEADLISFREMSKKL